MRPYTRLNRRCGAARQSGLSRQAQILEKFKVNGEGKPAALASGAKGGRQLFAAVKTNARFWYRRMKQGFSIHDHGSA
jgi:hypothetical protein